MDFNPSISLFKNARTNTPYPGTPSVDTMLGFIQGGTYRKEVEAVRNSTDKKERDELKKQLHAVTWSGTFSKRNADLQYLSSFSGIICHDIDKLDADTLPLIKESVSCDKRVFAVFTSPSGNGLKVLFRTETPVEQFLDTWTATGNYLERMYAKWSVKVDQACKDVSRLCFVSYDPDLHYYTEAKFIDAEFVELNLKYKLPSTESKVTIQPGVTIPPRLDFIAKCHEITLKTVQPIEGSFNKYINTFSIQANRYGLSEAECADAIASYCNWPGADKNDIAVIRSVYTKFAYEHNKWRNEFEQNRGRKQVQNLPEKPAEISCQQYQDAAEYNTDTLFWYVVGKIDKDTGEVVVNANTGEPMGEYKYSYDDAITFLQNNGFYKYRVGSGYQFIQVDKHNNQVEIVDELRIKEFMIDFLKSDDCTEYKRVREMFRRGAKNYCSTGILEGLEYYRPELTRDTATHSFVYFKNCFLDISAESIEQKTYQEQQGFIWKRQMLDFDFEITDFDSSDCNLFVWYASTGRKCDFKDRTPEEIQKYRALCSTIGYTLHRYKSPALTKAIITTDKKLRSTGENNGRSGKSLVIKLINKMLNVVTIDGRNFSFDKDFNFQKVNVDTALINFDDVKPNFDFSRLFSMITEEFSFEKKRIDLITIPFSDAPKFWISSNSTLKGGGESSIARQQIIEFSSYFNSAHSPALEFGRMFFIDWDNAEWQR